MIHRIVALVCSGIVAVMSAAEPSLVRESLWHGAAPTGDGTNEAADAFITIDRPSQPNGTAIVICPGGGYGMLCVQPEGLGIAAWLKQHGITGVVLEYRLPQGRCHVPLLDAQQAIRTVRARATELNLNPARIGIMGFSAGGHLAATAATHADPAHSGRPDFAVLVYPVISMGPGTHAGSRQNLLGAHPTPEQVAWSSAELQVTSATPPTYLAHAVDDSVVPIANSRLFADACTKAQVPVHLLELPSGNHGLNGYQGPMWDAWQNGALAWLAEQHLVPTRP